MIMNVSLVVFLKAAEYALELGPNCLQKYSKTSKFITSVFILSSQVGACAVYYLFIAENLKAVSAFSLIAR